VLQIGKFEIGKAKDLSAPLHTVHGFMYRLCNVIMVVMEDSKAKLAFSCDVSNETNEQHAHFESRLTLLSNLGDRLCN
jgi:predicted metallo-beta-lactamase superfamily hydrolase